MNHATRTVATGWLCLLGVLAAEAAPPQESWVPKDSVVVIQITQPDALLDLLLHPKLLETVKATPNYRQAVAAPQFRQFRNMIQFLESQLGTDWQTGLRKLVGGGVTWALGPGNRSLLIVDSRDPAMLKQLHEILLFFARNQAEKQGQPDRVRSAEYRGVTGWTFAPREAHAIIDGRLLVANQPEALKAAIDLREDPQAAGFDDLPFFRQAVSAIRPEAVGRAFVRLDVLKQLPGFAAGLRQQDNPLGVLLGAPVAQTLLDAHWLAVSLDCDATALSLEMVTDAGPPDPSGPAAFAAAKTPGEGAMPNLVVPRRIAAMSFYRDLHGFYAAKDQLFPERTSGLIFFENMMGIFFTGRDLTEEVLAELAPEMRFVVAEQEYDPQVGQPAVQIPAFAAVFRMRHPERFAVVVEEAWQKALGLINFTRGQQALPGLIIDRATHAGTKYTVAYFAPPDEEDRSAGDMRFNFRPALAMPGSYVILSSTDQLAEDIMDALAQQAREPLAGTHSLVEIDSPQLVSILRANRENLVRQNMIEEGHTRQEAETQIDLILTFLEYLGPLRWEMGTGDNGSRMELTVQLNIPD